jgi:RimJ/RimL family protein N-acetyltransferase
MAIFHTTLIPVEDSDFREFNLLRKGAMRPHVESQGLHWNEKAEETYNRELFLIPGLYQIMLDHKRIGFIGINNCPERADIGRFCIKPEYRGRGIGTHILREVIDGPICKDKKVTLDVLIKNPSRRLFERLGFTLVSDDVKLAHYERLPHRTLKRRRLVMGNKCSP